MRLNAIFLILNIQLNHIFASPPNPLELSLQANHGLKGYECGNIFFSDVEVKDVLSIALESMDKGYHYPQIYRGKLYSESRFQEYFLYPIRQGPLAPPHVKYPSTIFRVVFTRNSNEEVDVVARIPTGDYTKCFRRHTSNIEPSHSVLEIPNGYLCGHEFFTDMSISRVLTQVQTKVEGNTKYPSPYFGNLYPGHNGLLMWPIKKGKKRYISAKDNIGPYFLILNKERQFVDIVVRGYSENFLRCIRSRQPPEAPASDLDSKLFVPPPKTGYFCGKNFFDDKVLEENAKIVKNQVGEAMKAKFRVESSGPPCYQPCFIWPLFKDGILSKIGFEGVTRLILTLDFKVMGVAIYSKGKLKACERKTINAKKNHDTSDFHCNDQLFSHEQLFIAAEEACVKMNTAKNNHYPAKYIGPVFKLGGPYFTFPVFVNSVFGRPRRTVGLHRVVINSNCEVVGALTTLNKINTGDINDRLLKKLVKCHRLDDGPLPPGFFDANAETASEYKV